MRRTNDISSAERRRFERVPVEVPGKIFVPLTGDEMPCTITNLSPSGAEVGGKLGDLPETSVVLYADGFGRFDGTVAWRREGKLGLQFNSTSLKRARTAEQLKHRDAPASGKSLLRRHNRMVVNYLSAFSRDDGSVVQCKLLDLSISLETKICPPIGEKVSMGGMACRVVSHHENGVTLKFTA